MSVATSCRRVFLFKALREQSTVLVDCSLSRVCNVLDHATDYRRSMLVYVVVGDPVKGLVGLGRGRGLTPMQAVEAAFYNGKLQSRLDLFGEATLTPSRDADGRGRPI